MKTNLISLLVIISLIGACTKFNVDDEINTNYSNLNHKSLNVTGTYFFSIESDFTPVCQTDNDLDRTEDVAIYFSPPLSNDIIVNLKLETCDKRSGYPVSYYNYKTVISPWEVIQVDAGTSRYLLDASCYLPDYIDCGENSNGTIKTQYFRLKLETTYPIIDYEPLNGKNYIITKAKKQCFGSVDDDMWNDMTDDFHGEDYDPDSDENTEGGENPDGLG